MTAQDEVAALRLLIAQRRLHARAKRWGFLRWVGFCVIAVGAPVISAAIAGSAVAMGAVAGIWIFLSRTVFNELERRDTAKAASIQEDFDVLIFGMPQLACRDPHPTPEEIASLAGRNEQVAETAAREQLFGWYPFNTRVNGIGSIAIAQRANCAYSERLLNVNANCWLAAIMVWALTAVVVSVFMKMTLAAFLLGVTFPLLPALLDVVDNWRITKRAGAERRSMADSIEAALRGMRDQGLSGEDLFIWQERLYKLRCNSPQVPELIYQRTRERNEQAMKAAAHELANIAAIRQKANEPTETENGA
ncbi:S-4TM family putative pore-forming effector [Mycobacteroides abscessus]